MIRPLLLAGLMAAPLPVLAQDVDADTVLAVVGDTEITVGNIITLRSRLPQQYQELPDDALFNGILDQMIQQQILADAISTDLRKADELSVENERRAVLASRLIERISSLPLTDAEIQAAYEEEFGGFEAEKEWNASHILVETEDEARALVAMLADNADFATLAREHSTGPSGPNGGSLGWFGAGQMVPEFEEAVKGLEDGDVSPPVQTQFGWHVVKLNESRLTEAPPLDAVRAQIEQRLIEIAVDEEVGRLTEAATVERTDIEIDPAIVRQDDLLR
jgi:peptidyl-prolyl cis-trans isomerase C